jgi:hypothetical protein
MIRTYYARRILSGEFWGRLLTGKVPLRNLLVDPARHLAAKLRGGRSDAGEASTAADTGDAAAAASGTPAARAEPDLPAQLLEQLAAYRGTLLTVLSGNDLTAGETESRLARDKRWRKRLDRKGAILRVPGADHTFSQPAHWAAVVDWMARKAAAA